MLLLPFHCCICSSIYMSVYYMPLFACLYTMLLRHLRVARVYLQESYVLFCSVRKKSLFCYLLITVPDVHGSEHLMTCMVAYN